MLRATSLLGIILLFAACGTGGGAIGCGLDLPGLSAPTLEHRLRGEWYFRLPPKFASNEGHHFRVQDGLIVFRKNGVAWAKYDILDAQTIRLTRYDTQRPTEQLLNVRVSPDGSMAWEAPDTTRDPVFILTRENDTEIFSR